MSQLHSEKVIVQSPMSFIGATKRVWRLTDNTYILLKWLFLVPSALLILFFAYIVIACWYCIFGIFLVPFRLIRRSQRGAKKDDLRHREILQVLQKREM